MQKPHGAELVERVAAFARERGWSTERTVSAVAAALAEAIDLPSSIAGGVVGERFSPEILVELNDLARGSSAPWLLGLVYERLLQPSARRARGAHFTPADVAKRLVSFALDDLGDTTTDITLCDPACGGGVFLVAMASWLHTRGWSRVDAARAVHGADVDPLAVDVSRAALALWAGAPDATLTSRVVTADLMAGATNVWPLAAFTAVIGNPPFQNQLQRATTRVGHARDAAEALGATTGPYTDTAALFLLRALDLVDDGGRVALIQPQSTLVARDATGVREAISRRAGIHALWFARDMIFGANVRVCAPVLTRSDEVNRPPKESQVTRVCDRDFRPAPPIAPPTTSKSWASLIVDLLGTPIVDIDTSTTVVDIATATAGFRDEYYGLVGAIVEQTDAVVTAPRLVTCGLIDVLACRWGRRPARFARVRYVAPVVVADKLEGRVGAWVRAQLRPKLLVATQTKVIEVVVDELGDLVPSTPVIAVHAEPSQLWLLAAALTAPCVSAHALAQVAGAALGGDAIKLAARQVLALPLPRDRGLWERGATLAKLAQYAADDDRPELLDELGHTMDAAYGITDPAVFAWWARQRGGV